MQQRSREEWIAITVGVVLALVVFVISFLIFGFQQQQEITAVPDSADSVVESEVPAPGYEDSVEEMVVEGADVPLEQ